MDKLYSRLERHACYSNRKKKKHAGGRRIGNATSGGEGQDGEVAHWEGMRI